jgi:hypothetical protein
VLVGSLDVGLFNQVAAASDGSGVHVVFWRLANSGIRDVLYTQSQDGCHDWSPPTAIAAPDDVGVSSLIGRPVPAIDVSGNRVSIIWSETPSPEDPLNDTYIFYRDSHDLGGTFGDVKRLETTSNDSFGLASKDIASSGDAVHIVTSLGYFQSMDSGNTWSAVMPERAGNAIASDMGWTSIVGDERGSIFHIRFWGDARP